MTEVQPSRVARRLAAVLAADVAGYSRLMGLDEVGTVRALREHRAVTDALVAQHGGRIVKTAGDGVLLEFPSVVDAVECAVAVQTVMAERNEGVPQDRRMLYRIGINLGDILIEGDDIFGDGVNIAARLEGIAEPGGSCISSAAYDQVRGKTALVFEDLGERQLKNIERPVRVYVVRAAEDDAAAMPSAEPVKLALGTATPQALPDKPSIAVLPFQNMSGDPEQEYFADGVVEEIITSLSRFKSLFVIARNSCFTYKGRAVDIKQVGRELGVRYVLEGSIRKAGCKVRITGQLIDAATGAHLWAEKIDGALKDVFELQDEVTARVVGAIEPSITEAEISRAKVKPTSSLDAYDLYLRALSVHYSQTRSDMDEALRLLEQAIALDPNYSWAKAFAAYVHCVRLNQGWETPEDLSRGQALALQALLSSRDEPNTIGFAAHAHAWLNREYDAALIAMDRALYLNPNSAPILVRSGWLRNWVADADRAIDHFSRSIRLNPIDPQLGYAHCGLAFAHIIRGEYEKALEFARRAAHEMPRWLASWITLAVAAAYVGNQQEAMEAKERMLEIHPTFSIATYGNSIAVARDKRVLDMIANGFRLAGVPEG
jgi:adenylate cyclase